MSSGAGTTARYDPNPAEADGFAWLTLQELASDVARAPDRYSVWFRLYLRDHGSALTSEI